MILVKCKSSRTEKNDLFKSNKCKILKNSDDFDNSIKKKVINWFIIFGEVFEINKLIVYHIKQQNLLFWIKLPLSETYIHCGH